MEDFKLLTSRGDTTLPSRPLTVYLYPNEIGDETPVETFVEDGVEQLCDQLYGGPIDYYEIYMNTEYRPYLDDGDRDEHYNDFKSWYEPLYGDRVGMHLGVDNDYLGGRADGGEGREQTRIDNVTTFSIARCGVAGAKYGGSEGRTTAAHETLHPTINHRLDSVNSMTKGDEHHLGKVYADNTSSPLVNNYGPTMSKYGDCHSNLQEQSETTNITSCTYDAVQYTADNEFSN